MAAGVHQPHVFRRQLRVDAASHVGGHERGLAQGPVSGLGDPAVVFSLSGLADFGYQPGVGPDRGPAGEPVGVPEPAGDPRGQDGAYTGRGDDDLAGVGLDIQGWIISVFNVSSWVVSCSACSASNAMVAG